MSFFVIPADFRIDKIVPLGKSLQWKGRVTFLSFLKITLNCLVCFVAIKFISWILTFCL